MERKQKSEKPVTISVIKLSLGFAGAILLALLIGGIIGAVILSSKKPKEPEITPEMIESRIEQVSKLTTAEMTYTGMIRYSDGNIPLLTRKHFNMMYEAKINVGIEASEIKYEITEGEVIIKLPKARILDQVSISPDSLRYYDEQKAILNPLEQEDTQLALKKAQEDAELHANLEGITEQADANARELAQALFPKELLGERQLKIETEK